MENSAHTRKKIAGLAGNRYLLTKNWSTDKSPLERDTEFETDIIDTGDIKGLVLIARIAVIGCNLEAKICGLEWEECHTHLRRNIESPVVLLAYEGGHIDILH